MLENTTQPNHTVFLAGLCCVFGAQLFKAASLAVCDHLFVLSLQILDLTLTKPCIYLYNKTASSILVTRHILWLVNRRLIRFRISNTRNAESSRFPYADEQFSTKYDWLCLFFFFGNIKNSCLWNHISLVRQKLVWEYTYFFAMFE